jgi:hypothetical protein
MSNVWAASPDRFYPMPTPKPSAAAPAMSGAMKLEACSYERRVEDRPPNVGNEDARRVLRTRPGCGPPTLTGEEAQADEHAD